MPVEYRLKTCAHSVTAFAGRELISQVLRPSATAEFDNCQAATLVDSQIMRTSLVAKCDDCQAAKFVDNQTMRTSATAKFDELSSCEAC